jgi:hypothetical protein
VNIFFVAMERSRLQIRVLKFSPKVLYKIGSEGAIGNVG